MNRKIVASVAAVALAGGLVACSNDADTAAEATSTSVATDVATETVAAETETASSTETATETVAAESEASKVEGTEELALAGGKTAMVPQGVLDAINEFAEESWGEPTAAEEVDGGWIVTFDGEHYITWKESTGGSPIWGKIAQSWLNDVRGAREIGFPLAPETPNTDQSGWNQEFENGTLEWTRDGGEDAAFTAKVEQ
ncbi:LGFP repeat-containing protein [Corynebacterium sp. HMSC29G08]|uniref:LGFP repeat-containing protein n=1 Tax=Corynebacterium sp. HMSC29G08 TaxID=1581069 RepID=UPI0008A5C816|nr:hypothetical protein [Corynebacterium sp. HMSC29G08]OFT86244.1 hypothetical protein HMPREF3101_00540 [Corynebacterium sp. HMSC29G08]